MSSEPQTFAGKRLLDVFAPSPDAEDDPRHAMLLRDILEVERQAVAAYRADLEAEVRALAEPRMVETGTPPNTERFYRHDLTLAAVLRLLTDGAEPPEHTDA